jgi:hypothetical protein
LAELEFRTVRIQPKILKEKLLAIRGNWAIFGRVVQYGQFDRKVEMFFKIDNSVEPLQNGLTLAEISQLYTMLSDYAKQEKEL